MRRGRRLRAAFGCGGRPRLAGHPRFARQIAARGRVCAGAARPGVPERLSPLNYDTAYVAHRVYVLCAANQMGGASCRPATACSPFSWCYRGSAQWCSWQSRCSRSEIERARFNRSVQSARCDGNARDAGVSAVCALPAVVVVTLPPWSMVDA